MEHGLKSGDEHKRRAAEWKNLAPDDRPAHFSEHGVRWSEFMRLPYFDTVDMTLIDPMHNLLLGIIKAQWYNRWIQTGVLRATTEAGMERELADVHEFLNLVCLTFLSELLCYLGGVADASTAKRFLQL